MSLASLGFLDGQALMAIMRTAARSDAPGPRREAVSTARRVLTSVESLVRCTRRDGRRGGGHAESEDIGDVPESSQERTASDGWTEGGGEKWTLTGIVSIVSV